MTDNIKLIKSNTLSFFEKSDDKVIVFDHSFSKSYIVNQESYQILMALDGTKTIKDITLLFPDYTEKEIKDLFDKFLKLGLCSKNSVINYLNIYAEFIQNGRIIFWKEPEQLLILKSKFCRSIFRGILFVSFIIFLFEVEALWKIIQNSNFNLDKDCIIPAFIIFCTSLFLHEFSHAVFAKSFNANVCEIGFQVQNSYPFFRFYTDIAGLSFIQSTVQKFELHFAGILSNFFLIQSCWLFINNNSVFGVKIGVLIVIINILCIVIDLIPIKETDGYKIVKLFSNKIWKV